MDKRILAVVGALGTACGGGGGGGSADARPRIDAAGCLAASDYGSPIWTATETQGADNDPLAPPNPEFLVARGQITPDDRAVVELFADYGVFASGITTGTFDLTGEELNYATCGVCVSLFAGQANDNAYLATAGSVTVASVGPVGGFLDVTIDNIAFQHVIIDPDSTPLPFQSTPHPDGCTSALTTGQITGTIAQAQ